MFVQMIKKDLLLFWRRPRELIFLLLMPFVLITILGSALGSMNDSDSVELNVKLAVVQHDHQESGTEIIRRQVESLSISKEEKQRMIKGMADSDPVDLLLNRILKSDQLKNMIQVDIFNRAVTEKEKEKYSGVLEIPEEFTLAFYQHIFFQKNEIPALGLKLNESRSLEAAVIKDIVTSFQEEMSFWTTVRLLEMNDEQIRNELTDELKNIGEITTVTEKDPINTVTYYTIGMSVMFIFYVASKVSTFAFEQKENGAFGRILLANVSKGAFFTGIFVSTFVVAFLQMNILFGLSSLIFAVKWPNIFHYLTVNISICLMISGFALLISAISYRMNSESMSRIFSNFFVPILAFMGGSFFPVSQLGGVFGSLASYSPAGAGISAYFKVMQGYPIGEISGQIIALLITMVLLIIGAVFIQPKRGEAL